MNGAIYSEDDLLPISGLQHLAFCERQCALIHIESVWVENRLTAEGRILHERTHRDGTEVRGDVRIARGLRLRSLRLGLTGKADVVEFHSANGENADGIPLPDAEGLWRPFPVEYKRGRPKPDRCDMAQLCAQALCLEEMLGASITNGAIFYGQPRKRQAASFDPSLRAETEKLAMRFHELVQSGKTPRARYEKKCRNCSLYDHCLPKATSPGVNVASWLDAAVRGNLEKGGAEQ